MATKRVRVIDPAVSGFRYGKLNNKYPKNWDLGYELVVSFSYGLNEDEIARIAGLRNYDTGYEFKSGVRDLMFPCGTNKSLAIAAANRLAEADIFGVLKIKISYPVEVDGKNKYTPWYNADGVLLERVKHRALRITGLANPPRKRRIPHKRRRSK